MVGDYESNNNDHDWLIHAYEKLEPNNYINEFIQHNVRPDGRTFSACRSVSVLHSILVRNSVGSAMVTFHGRIDDNNESETSTSTDAGKIAATTTRVIAACTLLVGRPSPTTPTQGDIDITVTASPISGPTFDIAGRDKNRYYDVSSIGGGGGGGGGGSSNEHPSSLVGGIKANFVNIKTHDNINSSGGSGTDIKEIESYVRRTLRSSNYINPNELGIVLGTSAFRIRISLHIIDHGGNLRDCVLLAACAALADLRLPTIVVNEDGIVSIVKTNDDSDDDEMMAEIDKSNGQTSSKRRRRKGGKSLSLGPLPVPLTIAILPPSTTTDPQQQSILLADPTRLEENVSGGNIVTAVCNTNEEIVSYHKGGGGSGSGGYVTMEQMAAIAIMGFGRAKELEELVLGHR
jgi:exosome complex RNA-binding protein Rrp42 (RNase PH superfamily)